jgi:hypothetical protein
MWHYPRTHRRLSSQRFRTRSRNVQRRRAPNRFGLPRTKVKTTPSGFGATDATRCKITVKPLSNSDDARLVSKKAARPGAGRRARSVTTKSLPILNDLQESPIFGRASPNGVIPLSTTTVVSA